MKLFNIILISLFLTGCASPKLGPSANFYSPDSSMLVESPLDISGRFNGGMCSQNFAYINISIQNPSSEWKELKNITLDFPYGLNDQFEIVNGRKLKSWAVAQEVKEGRDNHNSQMAKLAVAGLGLGLIGGSNRNGKLAGAGLVAGVAASTEVNGVFKRKETAETGNSFHLLDGDLLVPPNMDRQYWLLLSAKKHAPFMDNIEVSYVDEKINQGFLISS